MLGDVTTIESGGTPSSSKEEYWEDGNIAWATLPDLHNKYLIKTQRTITKLGLKNSSAKLLPINTVILSSRATIGEVSIAKIEVSTNQGSKNFICDETKLNPEFLYYWLKGNVDLIKQMANGATFKEINKTQLSKIAISLPSLDQQHQIITQLSALDEKIEVNRRMNETLENIGQTLFKHYFIDNPEADDWEEQSLDEIANFLNGLAMQKYPKVDRESTLPVIKIREMSSGITENTDIASASIPEQYIVHDGDIIFSWSGTLIVKPWCDGKGALNQHLFKVTSVEYPKWFYYYWTKYHLQSFIETAAGKATTMGHIQRQHLTDAKVKVPKEGQLTEITSMMEPLLGQQILNELQNRKLSKLRDSLLPRLISGKIKV